MGTSLEANAKGRRRIEKRRACGTSQGRGGGVTSRNMATHPRFAGNPRACLPLARSTELRWNGCTGGNDTAFQHSELIRGFIIDNGMSEDAITRRFRNQADLRFFCSGRHRRESSFGQSNRSVPAGGLDPEPDVAVVRGTLNGDFRHRHPTDAELVVEVARGRSMGRAGPRRRRRSMPRRAWENTWIVLAAGKGAAPRCTGSPPEGVFYQEKRVYGTGEGHRRR